MGVRIPRRTSNNIIGRTKGTSIIPCTTPTSHVPFTPNPVPSSPPHLSSREMIYTPQKRGGVPRVFVVGGGPSLKDFNFSRLANVDTIVVNNAVFDVPNSKYFITMDYTWLIKNGIYHDVYSTPNQRRFLSKDIFKIFVLSFGGERCVETEKGVIDRDFGLEYDLRMFDKVVRANKYGGIGLQYEDFRCGSDSGYSALQLAVILGYEEIYLLGLDFVVNRVRTFNSRGINLNVETHYFMSLSRTVADKFESKLNEFVIPYSNAFKEIREKTSCKVFSCSSISRLNAFIPYVDISGVLEA